MGGLGHYTAKSMIQLSYEAKDDIFMVQLLSTKYVLT